MSDSPLTPDQDDAVRALLGAARHTDPTPADVVARLDAELAALVLVDMEGYSVAEAAAILDCAEGTIKSRCSRGRARLAPLLAALRPSSPPSSPGNPPSEPDVPSTGAPRGPPAAGR